VGDRRFERAAVRWHERFALEAEGPGFEGHSLHSRFSRGRDRR
jgi:hypothetical protein